MFALVCFGLLAACDAPAPGAVAAADTASAGVMIDSANYRHDRGMKYTLYDLTATPPRAVGGAIVGPLEAGGAKGCCLALPTVWRPGLKVRVEWGEADRTQIFPETYSRELDIPRYEAPADLFVVFYPEHEIELVVSAAEPGHPDWPGRFKDTPWNRCVATYGRKPCWQALPKAGLGLDELRGLCHYFHQQQLEDADKLCKQTIQECIANYEDEAMCNTAVWEKVRK